MSPRQCYSLFVLLAVGVFVATHFLQPLRVLGPRLPWWQRAVLLLAGLVGVSLGSRLPFALVSETGWFSQSAWLADGKTITTGLLIGWLAVAVTRRALGVCGDVSDGFALPLALALAVGRWGCFFNGCCHGILTTLPWGVDFGAGPCHPTQIYESLFHLAMAAVVWFLLRHDWLVGQRLPFYLIGYGLYRFLTEFIRPAPAWWLGLTFYQWATLLLVVTASVSWHLTAFDTARRSSLP